MTKLLVNNPLWRKSQGGGTFFSSDDDDDVDDKQQNSKTFYLSSDHELTSAFPPYHTTLSLKVKPKLKSFWRKVCQRAQEKAKRREESVEMNVSEI